MSFKLVIVDLPLIHILLIKSLCNYSSNKSILSTKKKANSSKADCRGDIYERIIYPRV